MTVDYGTFKRALLLFLIAVVFLDFPAFGAPTHGGSNLVTVTPSTSIRTLTREDRDVVQAIQGKGAPTQTALDAYAKFQRTLKTLFEDEGMEPLDLLAQLDRAIEELGSERIENFEAIHQTLAARYPDAEVLTSLLEARRKTTRDLFQSQPPAPSEQVALEGRVRRFGSLTNLSDKAAKGFLRKYGEALNSENLLDRSRLLAEILTAQGKRFRRVLPKLLAQSPKDVGNGSLEQDLLQASRWVDGKGQDEENPLRAAFTAAYNKDGGRAASNRSNFWGLVDESETARENGDTERVNEIAEELRDRWGSNIGGFLEGMRQQAVAEDATAEEKEQANTVLTRLTAALGEERAHDGKKQIVFRPTAESEPVVLAETEKEPWDTEQWDVARSLTSHFADRTDAFDRSQLLNTPVAPIQPEKKVPPSNPPQLAEGDEEAGHQDIEAPKKQPPRQVARRAPSVKSPSPPEREVRPKLRLTLRSCRCYDGWFGKPGRPKEPGFRFTSPHDEDTLAGVIERKLEAQGYDVELTWEEEFNYIGYFSLYSGDQMLFTAENDSRWKVGDPLTGVEGSTYGALFVGQPGGAKGVVALNQTAFLNQSFDPRKVGALDWAAILGHSLPEEKRIARR